MKKLLLALFLFPLTVQAQENWDLNTEKSSIQFSIVKDGNVTVGGSLKAKEGSVTLEENVSYFSSDKDSKKCKKNDTRCKNNNSPKEPLTKDTKEVKVSCRYMEEDKAPCRFGSTPGYVNVDLSTLDTGLELRDTNVKNYFFELGKKPEYQLARFDLEQIDSEGECPKAGCVSILKGQLTLHGRVKNFEVPVTIKKEKQGIRVKTIQDVTLSVNQWGFSGPIKKLMKICAHKLLDRDVKLKLDLVFSKK